MQPSPSQHSAPSGEVGPEAPSFLVRYDERLAVLRAEVASLEGRSRRISWLRLITLLSALAGGGFWLSGSGSVGVKVFTVGMGVVFVGLVVAHAVLVTRVSELEVRIGLFERAKRRVAGDSASLPARGERFATIDHDYAGDLDLFGPASLFQLLCTAETGEGESTLASWLASSASAQAVAERQEAARELATLPAFREELSVLGAQAGARGKEADPLIAWAESGRAGALEGAAGRAGAEKGAAPPTRPSGGATPEKVTSEKVTSEKVTSEKVTSEEATPDGTATPKIPARALVRIATVLVPLTLASFTATQVLDAETLGPWRHAWLALVVAQLLVLGWLRPLVEPTIAAAASREAPFGRYQGVLEAIERQSFSSPLLRRLQAEVRGGTEAGGARSASAEMRALQRILGYAEVRHSGLASLLLNMSVMWDLWCAVALDRWRVRTGRRVRHWMQALGQVEALASLGTFADENPEYAFPEVTDGPPRFDARGLGHPLLPRDRRVVNDVAVQGAPSAEVSSGDAPCVALLVTGSNMSGKSTLLRAIGANAVLALAGAPVCAAALSMTPVAVRTSMRISDSLEHGVSHFYAELLRLKRVVDSSNRGERVLFLLDEILHGTNSRERIIGAKGVVQHLIDHGAIGAVSSHDLGLAPLEEETGGRVRNVHFQELVVEDKMSFDYKLKPGVVASANALRLMKIVGITVDLPEA